jgi:hypothetical protein
MMMGTPWTYETLAQADRATLENVLINGTPPNMEELVGQIYCGWNHEWVGTLSGRKFKKGFYKKDGQVYGYNELVAQDGQGYRGEWQVRMKNARPIQLGYFRTSLVKNEPRERLNQPYQHLGLFDYNLPMNGGINLFFRVIRDFVVLPNKDDHSLILCKAYLQFLPRLNVFYCYFLLGHGEAIKFEPW